MASVWLLCNDASRPVADQLAAALADHDVTTGGIGTERTAAGCDAVVVLLADAPLPPASLEAARALDDRVVPVSVNGVVHPEFGGDNQILLPAVGLAGTAAQIAAVATMGGRTLAQLRQLFAFAHEWGRSGRHRNALIGSREQVDAARAVLAVCPPQLVHELAGDFVEASATYHRRRALGAALGAAVVAVVLVIATVVALAQRSSSATAAVELKREASVGTSKRLADLARSLLDTDPDLPRIAAIEALRQDPGPEAAAAARQVLAQTLAHRSISLEILPADVSAGGDLVAVMDVSGLTELRDAASGDLLRTVELGLDVDNVELAPSGEHLAMFGPDGFEVVATASGESEFSGSARFGVWAHEVLLTTSDGALEAYPQDAGDKALVVPTVDGELTAMAVDAEAGLIATIAGGRISVTSLTDGSKGWIGPAGTASDVEFAPTGQLIIISAENWRVVDDPTSAQAVASEEFVSGVENVRPLVGSGLAALDASGTLSLVYGMEAEAGTPTLWSGRAHQGAGSGLTALPDGGIATVGGDRYLRLWAPPPLPSTTAGRAFFEYWSRIEPRSREGARPSLALSPDGSVITVTQGLPAYVSMLDAGTLTALDGRAHMYLGDITVRAKPCGEPGLVLVATEQGSAYLHEVATEQDTPLPSLNSMVPGGVMSAHLGCSPNGSERAWADQASLRFNDTDSDYWSGAEMTSDGLGVAVLDGSSPLSIATHDGDRVGRKGIRARLTPDGVGVVAAGASSDRVFFAVGANGALYGSTPSSAPRRLADVAPDLEAYAMTVSADGRLVAVIGNLDTEIYDSVSGELFMALTSGDLSYRDPVRDLLFVEDGLVTIDARGALARFVLPSVDQLREALLPAPRLATESEAELILAVAR